MNTCAQCKKEMTKTRFCSRSCAAKFNNAAIPKRKRKNKCKECGEKIVSSRTYCEKCWEKKERLRKNNSQITTYKNFSGEKVDYEYRTFAGFMESRTLDPGIRCKSNDTIESFLQKAKDLLFSDTAYIHDQDKYKYINFIDLLEQHKLYEYRPEDHNKVIDAKKCELNRFDSVLKDWIETFASEHENPMYITYTLQTAVFLQMLLHGGHERANDDDYEKNYKIKGSTEDLIPHRELIENDKSLKKDMTQRYIGKERVECEIPENCFIKTREGKVLLQAGDTFLFEIDRCHLSSTIYDHYFPPAIKVQRSEKKFFLFGNNDSFDGMIYFNSSNSENLYINAENLTFKDVTTKLNEGGMSGLYICEVPVNWVKAIYKTTRNSTSKEAIRVFE